jgi:NAD(P)-dependent dehydrogenase (short-subunit alcohol dehydrogenase family)
VSNPVVLITGGVSGIGRAAAVAFAKKGARVVVAGRRDDAGKALVKELRSLGSEAEFINADVRKDDDVRALVDKSVARFGRLDVAVNNAGTEGQVGPITDQTAESYAATFDTNVLGVILSMKHEVRVMQGKAAAALSTSLRPTGTRVRRAPPSMSAASTPSKASPSRWRSRSPGRASA